MMLPVNFRVDEAVLKRAQERVSAGGRVKLPDLMRLAVRAIADGDATAFNDVLIEGGENLSEDINAAWLYHKCHELFEYKRGYLVRRSNKGQGVKGDRVDVIMKDGVKNILILGTYFPLKDIVWLMFHGEVAGEVIHKNKFNVNNETIENLMLNPEKSVITKINYIITPTERDNIVKYKLRALVLDVANSDRRVKGAIERLIYRGEAFHFILSDGESWRAVRRGIYAQKLSENTYCVSIS